MADTLLTLQGSSTPWVWLAVRYLPSWPGFYRNCHPLSCPSIWYWMLVESLLGSSIQTLFYLECSSYTISIGAAYLLVIICCEVHRRVMVYIYTPVLISQCDSQPIQSHTIKHSITSYCHPLSHAECSCIPWPSKEHALPSPPWSLLCSILPSMATCRLATSLSISPIPSLGSTILAF